MRRRLYGVESTRTRLAPDTRRAEILAVAREAFARGDYAGVSMADIAEGAGVTPGLVNHYLGPKRELYLTLLRDVADRIPEMIRTDRGDLSPRERIELNTRDFLDSVERDREDWALLFGAQAPRDPEVVEIVDSARERIVERMALNMTGGPDPSSRLRLALRMFQGAAEAGAVELLRSRVERAQLHEILVETLVVVNERLGE